MIIAVHLPTLLFFLDASRRSILCPLFFLIYINNLSIHRVSTVKQLAVSSYIFHWSQAKSSADELNSDLKTNLNEYLLNVT